MEVLDRRLKETEKVKRLTEKTVDFLKKGISEFKDIEDFLKDNRNFLKVRRSSIDFVKKNFKKSDKWEIRKVISQVFSALGLEIEKQNVDKIVFLLFTDVISELSPTPAPLVFEYKGYPLVKKHSIVIDFDLLPFLMETVEGLNSVKKHKTVFEIYGEDQLVTKGISKHISDLNFLILNLTDKVLYEEIIPFDQIVVQKEDRLQPDFNNIRFVIEAVFSGITEFFLGEKEILKTGLLNSDQSKKFVKIKNYVIRQLKNKDEFEYLLFAADADEESTEGRLYTVANYENQKNVFEESLNREDATNNDRIESIIWLIGIDNVNPVLLVRYFDSDDIVYYILDLLRQAQDENFLTDKFKHSVEIFLKKFFQYPYLSKGFINTKTLDKAMNILFGENLSLMADYYYYTRRYEDFLNIEKKIKEKTAQLQLKQLLAKHYTGEFSKEELINWLILIPLKEAHFLYNLFKNSLDTLPNDNEYRYVADLYTIKVSKQDIINIIGEEGIYTLILRVLGYYPYDKTLQNLAHVRFEL
ncbi:hypothetical protein [Persephonella sp.]